MLLQIMDTMGLALLGRHDDTRTDEYSYSYRTKKIDINNLNSKFNLSGDKMKKQLENEKPKKDVNVSKNIERAIDPTQKRPNIPASGIGSAMTMWGKLLLLLALFIKAKRLHLLHMIQQNNSWHVTDVLLKALLIVKKR